MFTNAFFHRPTQAAKPWWIGHPLVRCCGMQVLCWEAYGPKAFHDHHHHLEPEVMSQWYSEHLRIQYSANLSGLKKDQICIARYLVNLLYIMGYTTNIYKHYLYTTFVNWCQLHQSSLTLLKAGIFTPTPARRKCRSCTVFCGVGLGPKKCYICRNTSSIFLWPEFIWGWVVMQPCTIRVLDTTGLPSGRVPSILVEAKPHWYHSFTLPTQHNKVAQIT